MPDFSDLDITKYVYKRENQPDILTIPYRINIGCYNSCSFCAFRLGYGISYKDVNKIIEEMSELSKIHENVYFAFADCTITNNLEYINELLDIIISNKLKFSWQACANIDKLSKDLLDKLSKPGCRSIHWGLEHTSSKMQQVFNKTYDLKNAFKMIKYASSVNIQNEISFIFNGPTENVNDLKIQTKSIKKLLGYSTVIVRNYFFKLNENTLMYRNPEKYALKILDEPSPLAESINWASKDMGDQKFQKRCLKYDKTRQQLTILNDIVVKMTKKSMYKLIPLTMPLLFIISKLYLRTLKKDYM